MTLFLNGKKLLHAAKVLLLALHHWLDIIQGGFVTEYIKLLR
jgi:hypothetical protein